MTAWNDFVKKIYHEGHDSNPNYKFKQALKDASKRKGEMGATSSTSGKSYKKQSKKACMKSCKKSCKKRRMRGGMNAPSSVMNGSDVDSTNTNTNTNTTPQIPIKNLKGGKKSKRRGRGGEKSKRKRRKMKGGMNSPAEKLEGMSLEDL
jgi:hypothetical protein